MSQHNLFALSLNTNNTVRIIFVRKIEIKTKTSGAWFKKGRKILRLF